MCVLAAAAAVPARADPETGHGARRAYILKTSPHAAIVHATQNIQFEHQVETKWIFHAPQSGGFMPTSRPGDDSTIQSIKQQFKNQNENKNKLLTTNKLVGIIYRCQKIPSCGYGRKGGGGGSDSGGGASFARADTYLCVRRRRVSSVERVARLYPASRSRRAVRDPHNYHNHNLNRQEEKKRWKQQKILTYSFY